MKQGVKGSIRTPTGRAEDVMEGGHAHGGGRTGRDGKCARVFSCRHNARALRSVRCCDAFWRQIVVCARGCAQSRTPRHLILLASDSPSPHPSPALQSSIAQFKSISQSACDSNSTFNLNMNLTSIPRSLRGALSATARIIVSVQRITRAKHSPATYQPYQQCSVRLDDSVIDLLGNRH